MWNMCRGLALAGARVRVVTTDSDLNSVVEVPAEREEGGLSIGTARVVRAAGRMGSRYALAPSILPLIHRGLGDADLCVLQGVYSFALLWGPRMCRRRGIPYVICPRGTLESLSLGEKAWKKSLYLRVVMRGTLRRAAAIQFASDEEMRNSVPTIGSTPAFVCENAIDIGELRRPDIASWRRSRGIPGDVPLIGMAGRLHPRKGFSVLLPALARCSVPFHLVAFGADEDGYGGEVLRLAASSGIRDRVHLLGELRGTELQDAYACVDLLTVPSFGESFGNVAVEAMAQGTEVMVSDRVPVGRYAESRGLGWVIAGHEPATWAAALDRWATGPRPRERARAAAATREDFGVETTGRKLLGIYRRLANGQAPQASVPAAGRTIRDNPS